jgi:hypothetical protein
MAIPPPDIAHPETGAALHNAAANGPPAAPAEDGGDLVEPVLPSDYQLPSVDIRERSLPIRQGDLTRMLLAQPEMTDTERSQLAELGSILGATFHSEFFGLLRELKELYAPLDPDADYVDLHEFTRVRTEGCDERFLEVFESVLERANYRPLSLDVLKAAISAPNEMGLTYIPDFTLFEHLKVYVRGFTQITRDCRSLRTRFKRRTVALDAYQRLVVALKFKPSKDLGPAVRSDVLYLRVFKDVPHVDMEMHLPEQGTQVRMRWIDKAKIASPLFMGIPTMVLKFMALITVSPWVLGGLLIPPISAGVNSFFGFHRAKEKHLYAMIHKLYYLTLANNASVLTRLIDTAEDEEYKEAMLAYFFLWRGTGCDDPWTVPTLDARIEHFLATKTRIEINFEVSDALAKLLRLGLATRDAEGRLYATPIDRSLSLLDRLWDNTFCYPEVNRPTRHATALDRC